MALDLPLIFAFTVALSIALYVVLDGFDLGVGILLLQLLRSGERSRRGCRLCASRRLLADLQDRSIDAGFCEAPGAGGFGGDAAVHRHRQPLDAVRASLHQGSLVYASELPVPVAG